MYSIGIDCGVKYIGISLFKDGVLTGCEYIETTDKGAKEADIVVGIVQNLRESDILSEVSSKEGVRVLIEYPEQYSYSPVPRSSVQGLAFTAGALAVFFKLFLDADVDLVLPKEWKGQVPKEIFLKRIIKRLANDEYKVLKSRKLSKAKEHNVIDAIGLGLKILKRL